MSELVKPRILFVDGDVEAHGALLPSLETAGFEVLPVQGAKAALERLRNTVVDIVIMDVNMEDMDGYQLCRLLKKDSQFDEIPIIFLTEKEGGLDSERCFEEGGADYLDFHASTTEMVARVKAQHKLTQARRNELRDRRILSVAMATMKDVACCVDASGRVLLANSAAKKWFGQRIIEGKDYFTLSKGRELVNAITYVRDALENGSYFTENVMGDGVLREVAINPVYDDLGEVTAVFIINRDVKAKVDYDERVRDVQLTASLGRLAGGALQELDVALTGMVGYLSLLQDQLPDESEVLGFFREVISVNDRTSETVSQLLGYLGQDEPSPMPLDIELELQELFPYLTKSLPDGMTCDYLPSEKRGVVEMDQGQFRILTANLAYAADTEINGVGGVELITDVGDCPIANREMVTVGVRFKRADTIRKDAWRKPSESNMALDVVQYLVDCNDGRFTIDTHTPGTILFSASFPTRTKSAETVSTPGTKVLVVDDEPVIRQMLSDCFDIIGYEGIYAESGEDAVEVFEGRRAEIGLVLLDMVMPGLCGDDVLKEIRLIDDSVPVVISSAHAKEGSAKFSEVKPDGWLEKPFKITQLKDLVERFIPKT